MLTKFLGAQQYVLTRVYHLLKVKSSKKRALVSASKPAVSEKKAKLHTPKNNGVALLLFLYFLCNKIVFHDLHFLLICFPLNLYSISEPYLYLYIGNASFGISGTKMSCLT